jgi:hypothetical protein
MQCRRSIRRLFDKNILFHKTAAYLMSLATGESPHERIYLILYDYSLFFAAVHIIAHLFNVNNFVKADGLYPNVKSGEVLNRCWI